MDLIAIIQHAELAQKLAPLSERLIDIYSGNLNEYVKASLAVELNADSYKTASQRVPSINVLEKITDKLSRVYNDVPTRTVPDVKEQEIVNQYIESMSLQDVMNNAEVLLNLNKCFALEPYVNESGLFSVRLLAPHEFTVYSDDIVDPSKPTALIKFMGGKPKGKKIVSVFWIYTNELFLEVDSDGEIMSSTENPYGVIPFVYCSADKFRLQPKPDIDSFENTVLIPKLLTDLNFAVKHQSFSLVYGIDVNVSKDLQIGPDSFLNLKSEEGDKKPQLGQLSPTVDVDKVLALIGFTVSNWLDSKGIKSGSGNVGSVSPESAISKLVDEADASQIIQSNRLLLTKAEQNLWKLISVIHNALVGSDTLKITTGMTEQLHVSIGWPVSKPIVDPNEKRQDLEFKLKNKLISYDRALRQANPELSNEEIEKLKQEIAEEKSNV